MIARVWLQWHVSLCRLLPSCTICIFGDSIAPQCSRDMLEICMFIGGLVKGKGFVPRIGSVSIVAKLWFGGLPPKASHIR